MKGLRNLKHRYPVAFGVSVGAFLAAGAAAAAFLIYSGINGSSNGTFDSGSTVAAITISGDESTPIDPGSTVTLPVTLTNNDPNAPHTLQNVAASITSTPTVCASHLSVTGFGAINGQTVAAGGTIAVNTGLQIVADSTLPSTCASGTFSITWSGETQP